MNFSILIIYNTEQEKTTIKMIDFHKEDGFPTPIEQIKYIILTGKNSNDINIIKLIKTLQNSKQVVLRADTIINNLTNYTKEIVNESGEELHDLLKATPIMYSFYNILLVFKLVIGETWDFPRLFITTPIANYGLMTMEKSEN